MELQIALDCPLATGLALLRRLAGVVDRAELGTPLLLREGLHAARSIRENIGQVPLTADAKIMDAGELEADLVFRAGCDIVTVLAAASDNTIIGAVRSARRHGGRVMVDMIEAFDPIKRAHRLWQLGIDMVCVHTASDVQGEGESPLATLSSMRHTFPDRPIAVAGGLGPDTVEPVLRFRPAIIIAGSAILNAQDPLAAAKQIKERMTGHG